MANDLTNPPVPPQSLTLGCQPHERVEHREWILGGLKVLMSFYWQPESEDHRITTAVARAWADDLERFPQSVLAKAFEEWRQTETKRPAPAHIIALCLSKMPKPRLQHPVSAIRNVSPEERGQVAKLMREAGFGGPKVMPS